jgi:C4-dicarboxylate-specific signal transduction histidine kinase
MPDELLASLADEHALRLYEQLLQVARTSALEELSSGMAHELNQPLGAIATFAQAGKRMLRREQPLVVSTVDVLDQINTQALAAGDSIHRMRSLFAIPTGNRCLCEPRRMLEDVLPILEAIASREGVSLDTHLDSDLRSVLIDPVQIQYVLLVLAQNAVEAAPQNASSVVRIDITEDAYTTRVSVTDAGPGVPEDARDKLFRPFFTTKRNCLGLGLASGRSVVEAHGGNIGYEHADGGGSRFWFSLPANAG